MLRSDPLPSSGLQTRPAPQAWRRFSFSSFRSFAPEAANDNDVPGDHALLRAALRLAAERGAAAAHFAHAQAEQAYFAGGGEPYQWWLSLTRVLDRMLAADFAPALAGESRPCG
jgi:hypothetical protein